MKTSCVSALSIILVLCLSRIHQVSSKSCTPQRSTTTKPRTGCVVGGEHYEVGETFKIDCNTCQCRKDGLPVCTKIFCGTTEKPSGCTVNGVHYKVGETFKDDCNTCSCTRSGIPICTLMACLPTTTESTTTTTTKKPSGCTVGGVHYEVGETFKDDCNTCSCTSSGFPICTLMACPPKKTETTTTTKKPSGCVENGVHYDVGETFKKDCNTCSCTSTGAVACTRRACFP